MALFLLSLRIDFLIPGGPASEGPVDLPLYGLYGNMIEALLPVAIICAGSLFCTAVWLLVAGSHLRSGCDRAP